MSSQSEENARFVTWPCQHCNGPIEFDANELTSELGAKVPCPHCGKQTWVFDPSSTPVPAVATKPGTVLHKVMRSMVIAWSVVCFLGLGGCVVTSFITAATTPIPEGQSSDTFRGGVSLIGIIMSILGWLVIWVLVAVPCATIYMVSKKKE